jgi:hypothetical protein
MLACTKEIIKEQPPARELSATVGRVLQCTNVAYQRPPFWSAWSKINAPSYFITIKELCSVGPVT